MPHADAAWLRMDSATNLMVINSLMWFDETPNWERLRANYIERVVDRFPRFRQLARAGAALSGSRTGSSLEQPLGGAAGQNAAGTAAVGGADHDHPGSLVAGERVKRARHRGVGDDSRLHAKLLTEAEQRRRGRHLRAAVDRV
jgi:hypothetical protein